MTYHEGCHHCDLTVCINAEGGGRTKYIYNNIPGHRKKELLPEAIQDCFLVQSLNKIYDKTLAKKLET